ncbi:Cytochrome_B5 [Hexamita inflata]|uniref:Outer mitochondrial membrane n=1 Tax=Hexamita inflata TaxID=28002 RepID=A0AA86UFS9_9EUKA|nr:Cytochrome B5 [Hexamita inflata]
MRPGPSGIAFINKMKSMASPNMQAVESNYISLAQILEHNTPTDGWIIYRNYVYDVTPYLMYHPGGTDCFIPLLGTDITETCQKIHNWVNIEFSIKKLVIGKVAVKEVTVSSEKRNPFGK